MTKVFAFIIFMASTIGGFSCGCEEEVVPAKIYILPDHLQITEKAMFVFLENVWEPMNHLFSDEEGLYIVRGVPAGKSYYCNQCGYFIPCTRPCKHGASPVVCK